MRIKEFLINRYGPLSYDAPVRLGNFSLLWGENERGKTLTIDALIKLLLGKNVRDFACIDRVEEYPSGYAVIEDSEGQEVKVPDSGNLTSIVGLSASECRNIFIIRNSELMIESEGQFYTEVTDRLTGLRTTEIELLQHILRDLGKLTPSGSFRNTGVEKLKSRIDSAVDMCDDINTLIEKVEQEELDSLEQKIVEKEEEIAEIEHQLHLLDEARKRERYEKGKDALEKLEKARQDLKPLESFNNDDVQLWQECESAINSANVKRDECTQKLEENEQSLQSSVKERQAKERDFQIIGENKKQIDNAVKPKLENCREESERLAAQEASSKFWDIASITSAALFALSLVVGVIGRAVPLYILTGVLFLLTALVWVIKFRFQATKARLAKLLAVINLNLSKHELQSDSIEGILTNIQKLEDNHTKMSEELQEMKREEAVLVDRIKNLREEDIPQEEREIGDSQNKIDDIIARSGVKSLSEYKKRLQSKQACENSIAESVSILDSHFSKISDNLSENITHWQQEVSEIETYKDKSQQISYDEKAVTNLKDKNTIAHNELVGFNNAMESFRKELEEIEKETQWTLGIEAGHVPCSTTVDLAPTYSELEKFVNENEDSRDKVLSVLEILKEIETEEKEKVSELFGGQSAITEYYSDITGGLYEVVLFNQQERIQVRRRDGKLIEASNLSGGAYDQLYFSIRLALGDRLLKGEPGFFIIDDPFIKADPERLRRQMAMLKNTCEKGWQIVYFSAKGEVKDALADDIDNGIVSYSEINNVYI